jgi:hypothetical protein
MQYRDKARKSVRHSSTQTTSIHFAQPLLLSLSLRLLRLS